MNDTSASSMPGASLIPDGTGAITLLHFALIGVVALLVIAAILWGARLKRGRIRAHREVVDHAQEAGVPVQPDAAEASAAGDAPLADPSPASEPPMPAGNRMTPDGTLAPHGTPDDAAPAADGPDGPVTQLKGLGPKVAARLAELGVVTVGQIAALDDDAAQALDTQLGGFAGRLARDRWIEQARFLAAGDRAGFEAVFGRL